MRISGILTLACLFAACGPSAKDFKAKEHALEELRAENASLKAKVAEVESRLAAELEKPDRLLARAKDAVARKEYAGSVAVAERLIELHPDSKEAPEARRIAASGRSFVLRAAREADAEAEKQRRRDFAKAEAAANEHNEKLLSDLHRNLDGVGNGFVRSWELRTDSFVLVIDPAMYVPNRAVAAAMTARSIFETNGVSLPRLLVFRDIDGNTIESGPFSKVPSITQ